MVIVMMVLVLVKMVLIFLVLIDLVLKVLFQIAFIKWPLGAQDITMYDVYLWTPTKETTLERADL